jgi:hypothetical protein
MRTHGANGATMRTYRGTMKTEYREFWTPTFNLGPALAAIMLLNKEGWVIHTWVPGGTTLLERIVSDDSTPEG